MTRRWTLWLVAVAMFVAVISQMGWWEAALRFFFPAEPQVLHPRGPLLALVAEHLEMVILSSGITVLIGLPLGIWVTRRRGRAFLPLATNLTAIGQTFPPVAVLALAVPALGFGFWPTIAALFLYGLLPVVRNTIEGLEGVPADVLDAAYGAGMSRLQALIKVELPLAAPVILAGIRISVVINIGTATIGAAIGAGGLGSPIIAGLVEFNIAYILEGAIPAALLALLVDGLLANVEGFFAYPKTG